MTMLTRALMACLLVLCLAQALQAAETNTAARTDNTLCRGLVSVLTGPCELVRCLTYDGADHAMLGILTGVGKGSIFTLGRFWGGLTDVVCMGFVPEKLDMYQRLNLKDFVWQEPWWPAQPEQKK